MLNDGNVEKSRDLHDPKANRQFVENVYTLNAYFSTTASPPTFYQTNQWPYAQILVPSLTTERPLQTFLAPATQTETILVDYSYDPSNGFHPDRNYFNFNTNLENGETFQYQIPRPLPPINPNPIVNIPYRRRPEYSAASPTLLHLSKNITRLYSVTTPDPYNQYQKLHIKPPVTTERKSIKLSVSGNRPHRHHNHNSNNNNKHHKHHSDSCQGNCHNGNYNVKKTNKNGSKNGSNNNNNHNHNSNDDNDNDNDDNSWDNENHFNAVNVQYNESSQIISNFNSNPHLYSTNQSNNPNNVNANFHTINQQSQNNTKSKECLIKFNSPNVLPGENVCDTNDLKIIIKFDNPSIVNNTTEKPKQRKKRPSKPKMTTTTTTTTPAPTSPLPFYYSADNENDYYESTEIEEEESGEFGSFLRPLQNMFGFGADDEGQAKRPNRRKKPSHGNDGHGNNKPMAVPDINKYQTIILQSPAPPTMAPSPSSKHNIKKSTLLKFLAFLPILTVLKPALFGLWTLVLSPILVITIGGIALGVVLYPFLTISREQTISYSSPYRSARVVIHKHPKPLKRRRPQNHIVIPADKRSRPPFDRRRTFTIEPHLRYRIGQNTPNRRRVSISRKRWQPRPPLRIRTFHHHRSKRRAQDARFQQWLLIQNNFNVRVMSYNDGDNDFYDDYH